MPADNRYLDIEDILELDASLSGSARASGSWPALEGAIGVQGQSAGGEDAYPTLVHKAFCARAFARSRTSIR